MSGKATVSSGFLLIRLGLVLLVVIAIGGGIYFYQQYDKKQKLTKNPQLSAQIEQKSLVEKIGKLIELPTDEQPTVATVSDVTKLKAQPFFTKARNGFKVLIYPKNKKAILYDPAKNKIIEVGPINIGNSEKSEPLEKAQGAVTPVTVVIYNGTKIAGLASSVEKDLKSKAPYVSVVKKGNAEKDYTKTLVIDLNGSKKEAASQLAKVLSGEVAPLPEGEIKPASPSADILVILGK